MPSLVLFNHRTLVAGDDLRIFASVGLLLRLIQISLGITLILFLSQNEFEVLQSGKELYMVDPSDCLSDQEEKALAGALYSYLAASVVLTVIAAILERVIWVISGQGTPTEPEKRSKLKVACYTNLTLMMVLRSLMMGIGVYVLVTVSDYCRCAIQNKCQKSVHRTFLVLVYTNALDILYNLLAVVYFGCKCMPQLPRSMDSETKWRICCRLCCTLSSIVTCCLMGGREAISGDFTDITMLLSDFFDYHGTLDLVASDLVAGLLMVRRVQQERVEECRQLVLNRAEELKERSASKDLDEEDNNGTLDGAAHDINAEDDETAVAYRLKRHAGSHSYWEAIVTKLLIREKELDVIAIAEGARFMRLSLAIYTWMMYTFNRPYTGLCEVSCLSCQQVCTKKKLYAGDTKCCRLHSAAFMKEAGVDETEVAYAQFKYSVTECPYAIVIDHDWQSIVIVIRGTLSLEDMLTDLTLRPTCLEELGEKHGFDGRDRYAHAGMLVSSEWIFDDIAEQKVLRKLLHDDDTKFSNYQLRITGHSLGAGCAAILGLMLKPKYPDLLCHCFSPPGCTLSENSAVECEDYLTSYVLDNDLIPRSSLTGLENLRYDIVEMIARIKVPKHEVLWGYGRKNRYADVKATNAKMLHDEEDIPDSDFKRQWRKFHELYQKRKTERVASRDMPDVELFPPGKFVHLMKKTSDVQPKSWSPRGFQGKRNEYVARWAHRLDLREVRISATCIDDHNALNVLNALEEEAQRMNLKIPFVPQVFEKKEEAAEYSAEQPTGRDKIV